MRRAFLLLLLLWTSPADSQEEKRIVVWHSYQGAARLAFEKLVDTNSRTLPASAYFARQTFPQDCDLPGHPCRPSAVRNSDMYLR